LRSSTEPSKIVSTTYGTWNELRVPNGTLQLHEIDTLCPGRFNFDYFVGSRRGDFKQVIRVLINLAVASQAPWTRFFGEKELPPNTSYVGILLLQDKARVSIESGRIKERDIFLFEKCLVLARQKSFKRIIVRRLLLCDLLQVRHRQENSDRGGGVLEVYCGQDQGSEEQRSSKLQDASEEELPNGTEVSGIQIFFKNPYVLKIWAAFLAVHAASEPRVGHLCARQVNPRLGGYARLHINNLRYVLNRLPAIRDGQPPAYDYLSRMPHLWRVNQ
jgi:hypothetical protein